MQNRIGKVARVLWSVVVVGVLAACTGAPATVALQPDFEIATASGNASVSIRQSPPGMESAEFERLVREGMATTVSVSEDTTPAEMPFHRIVWHVTDGSQRGLSRLSVGIFAGSVPVAYAQDMMANPASRATITAKVASLTKQVLAQYAWSGPKQVGGA